MIAVRDGFGDHMHPKWWLLQENIKIYLPTEHGIPIWQQTLQKNERSRQGEVLQGKGGLWENHWPGFSGVKSIEEIALNFGFLLLSQVIVSSNTSNALQDASGATRWVSCPQYAGYEKTDMGMFEGASELVAVGQVSGTPSGRTSTAGDKKKYCWWYSRELAFHCLLVLHAHAFDYGYYLYVLFSSNQCVVLHCDRVFKDWVKEQNQGGVATGQAQTQRRSQTLG